MALIAAIATAMAAACATVALGGAGVGGLLLPPVAIVLGLLPGLALARTHPDRRTPATGREMRLVITFTGVVVLLLYLVGGPASPERLASLARLGILCVLPLSLLWPAPTILRYCLLISVACLLGAGSSLATAPWPVAGLAASTAVALVALNRVAATAEVPRLAPGSASPPRRVAGEALLLLAVAGLVGLLVSAILPPPDSRASGGLEAGDEPDENGQTSPYLNPSGELDAGGPGSGKGDKVLLRISAPAPAMWRTQTFDRWNGRAWSRSRTVDQPTPSGFGSTPRTFSPPGIGDAEDFGERFVQRVRVEAGRAGLLAAAPRAVFAEMPSDRQVRISRDGTMRPVPALGKGATYIVTSTRSTPDPDQLRQSYAKPDPDAAEVPDEVADPYLQLPPVPAPVRDLATQLAGGAPTGYDKATAVEDWVFSNTTVGKGTERLPAGEDPIQRFLLVDRTGSAEQAASAMVVMLRSLGLPARVAVGFLPGDRYALGGEFVVRARHAHAWVEAWFPGFGWVAFDPSGRGADVQAEESVLDRLRRLVAAVWWVLAIALAVAVRWLTRRWLRRWQQRRSRPWVTRSYERLVRAGRAVGRPREPSETPTEYCLALAEETQDGRLVEVGEVITAAAYSGREPPPETRAWVDRVVREAEPRLRRGERRLEKSGRR